MPAQRVAKLEALLARVQTRAAESRATRGSPALNVAPILRSRFEDDAVTGKVQAVAESSRITPPQIVPDAAKSAPKIAAAAPAVAAPPIAVAPAQAFAHVDDGPEIEIVPQKSAPKPAPMSASMAAAVAHVESKPDPVEAKPEPEHAKMDPTPLGPPVREPDVAPAMTPSPAPAAKVALAKVAVAKVAVAKAGDAKPASPVVPAEPARRGRQFVVAILLMLWILVVAAVVGLFFTGRLPMP